MTLAYHPEVIPTYHPRSEWEDRRYPIDATYRFKLDDKGKPIPGTGFMLSAGTAPKLRWSDIVGCAVHYTADDDLIDGDPGEWAYQLPGYMRSMQLSYALHRAYSLGYNWAVDWLGGIWEIRGFDLKTAAHAPWNEEYVAVLVLVDGSDTTTPLADHSIRWIMDQCALRSQKFNYNNIVGHKDLAATACPGDGAYRKVQEGVYWPSYVPPGAATDPSLPPQGDNDVAMLIQPTDAGNAIDPARFAVNGTLIEWIDTEAMVNSMVLIGSLDHDGVKNMPPGVPFKVDRGFLQYYTLIGTAPVYPVTYTGPKTSPADFKRWVP